MVSARNTYGNWIITRYTRYACRKPTYIRYVTVIVRPTWKNILEVYMCRSSEKAYVTSRSGISSPDELLLYQSARFDGQLTYRIG